MCNFFVTPKLTLFIPKSAAPRTMPSTQIDLHRVVNKWEKSSGNDAQRFLEEDLSNYLRGYELYGTVCTAIYNSTIIQANLPRNRKTHCNHRKGRSSYDDCQLRVVDFGAKMNEERLSSLQLSPAISMPLLPFPYLSDFHFL